MAKEKTYYAGYENGHIAIDRNYFGVRMPEIFTNKKKAKRFFGDDVRPVKIVEIKQKKRKKG